MLMDTLIFLSMSTQINYNNSNVSRGEKRILQYVDGLQQFFSYKFKSDVLVFDNTLNDVSELDPRIQNVISDNVRVIVKFVNKYGPKNKGAGVLEQWNECKDIFKQYKHIIHFEPRLILKDPTLVLTALDKPTNLFTLSYCKTHFKTGLFCIESTILVDFIQSINIPTYSQSLEHTLYNYMARRNIKFDVLRGGYCIRHEESTGTDKKY